MNDYFDSLTFICPFFFVCFRFAIEILKVSTLLLLDIVTLHVVASLPVVYSCTLVNDLLLNEAKRVQLSP